MRMHRAVYLDTNAVIALSQDQVKLEAVARGGARAVTSVATIEELARIAPHDWSRHERQVATVRRLAESRILRDIPELVRLEIQAGGEIPPDRRYLDADFEMRIWKALADPEWTEELVVELSKSITRFGENERERREHASAKVRSQSQATSLAKTSRAWWEQHESRIVEWANDAFAKDPSRLGLPERREDWPDPRDLPVVWHIFAFRLARIHLTVGEGRKVQDTDWHDGLHYASAAYSDVFVTDDRPLTATASVIAGARFKVNSLASYLEEISAPVASP